MKQLNDLSLAALSSGLEKVLSEELGGEFEVTVRKLERKESSFGDDGLLLSFAVKDASVFRRYQASKKDQWLSDWFEPKQVEMTADLFKERAKRTATETEIIYDVRPLQAEQQQGIAVFLGELVFRLGLNKLAITKPLALITDDAFQDTEQLEEFRSKLGEAGLVVTIRRESETPTNDV